MSDQRPPDDRARDDRARDARTGDERTGDERIGAPQAAPGAEAAPETVNTEQDDEDSQAQSVADQAYHRDALGLGDTVKVSTGDDLDDVQDLVDHMRQMDSSGLIDMGAFAGERNDDEEEGRYGPAAEEE